MIVAASEAMLVAVTGVGLVASAWSFTSPRVLRSAKQPEPGLVLPVSVVIPARNEAERLPNLLAALAACRPAAAEVIVVDDASSDGTAAVAEAFGVTVIEAPPLPDGWVGKNWACHIGASEAGSPTLVFLDADTLPAAGFIGAVDELHRARGGLVSVQPYHCVPTATEQCSAVFNLISLMGSGAFSARPPEHVRLAFGPCLVTTATDYAAAGGHAAVRSDIVEDIGLAERYAALRLPVTCALGGDQLRFRMYAAGLRSLIEGWTKNIAAGAGRAAASRTVLAAIWVAALCAVGTATIFGLVRLPAGGQLPVAAGLCWIVLAADLHRNLRRIGSFNRWTSVLFVVPVAFFVVIFVRSAVAKLARRPVLWRGRTVAVSPARSR